MPGNVLLAALYHVTTLSSTLQVIQYATYICHVMAWASSQTQSDNLDFAV